MAEVKYTIIDKAPGSIPDFENYSSQDLSIIENYTINKDFNFNKNYIESHFYDTKDNRLVSLYEYGLPNKGIITKPYIPETDIESDEENDSENITQLTLDPVTLSDIYGYSNVEVKILFHFLNDCFTYDNKKQQFFINEISKDRKEVLIYTDALSSSRLISAVEKLSDRLTENSYFDELYLNFGNNDLFIVTNIGIYELDDRDAIKIKLYEPLPIEYDKKSTLQVVEKISDSVAVLVTPEFEPVTQKAPSLLGPNFSIELEDSESEPTEFFNYDQLFSFSNTNNNRELYSYINKSGVDIGIDYSNLDNFINFSSATERLKNFKYKVELIETYQADLDTEQGLNNSSTQSSISGSIVATENLIKGVISNFDHYERHLYYESGSTSWPKSNSSKPFVNQPSAHADVVTWYSASIASASIYDDSNYDSLTNFLPDYLGEDTRNQPAVLFTQMLGQHYDNLWIYTRAITDKYDTDNRLDFGISKNLVKEAVKSLGIKVYNSIEGANDLFKYLINDTYDSGSAVEIINNFPQPNNADQPISSLDYESEVFKRIYHNIPFLLKSKGTRRGVRALINCFGIPDEFIKIRTFGSRSGAGSTTSYGPLQPTTETAEKIHIKANTPDFDTLAQDVSTTDYQETSLTGSYYNAPDLNEVEVGFSLSDRVDTVVATEYGKKLNLDTFLGDPTNLNKAEYELFDTETIFGDSTVSLKHFHDKVVAKLGGSALTSPHNLKDFVRVFKFHDNILFKMVKDFIPERANLSVGMIIKNPLIVRPKIKSPELFGEQLDYSGSIDTAFITGSDGGTFNFKVNEPNNATRELLGNFRPGKVGGISDLILILNSQLLPGGNANEVGELSLMGSFLIHPDGTKYDISGDHFQDLNTPFEGLSPGRFHIMHTTESVDQRFGNLTHTGGQADHFIPVTWDSTANGNLGSWKAHGNDASDTELFNPESTDLIIATIAYSTGINTPSELYYQSTSGNNTYPSGSNQSSVTSTAALPNEKDTHFNPITFYEDIKKTKVGPVTKLVKDEAPKLTGEFSGSELVITDGELNDDNVFKKDRTDSVLFDIESIQQSAADILKGIELLNDGDASSPKILSASSAANACALGNFTGTNGTDIYHTDTSDVPTAGKILYTNPGGLTADLFDEGSNTHKFFKMLTPNETGDTLYALEATASNGEILSVTPCSNFDSDPPSTFNYTFGTTVINSGNQTSVPVIVHGLDDAIHDDNITLTVGITGSEGGTGTHPIVSTLTISSNAPSTLGAPAATHSFNVDCSSLNNGSTGVAFVSMSITASDASNLTRAGTPLTQGAGFAGHIISKSALTVGDFEVDFVTDDIGGTTASFVTTAKENGQAGTEDYKYHVRVKGLENNNGVDNPFAGTIQVTLSGLGNTITKTQIHEATNNSLTSQSVVTFMDNSPGDLRTISNRTSGTYSNSVTATVIISDAYGNTGPTKTNTVTFRDRTLEFHSTGSAGKITQIAIPYTNSSATVQLIAPKTGSFSYLATTNVSWITINSSDVTGTVDNTSFNFTMTENQNSTSRTGHIEPKTDTGNGLNQYAIGHRISVIQDEFCVDPETSILTPTGQTAAKALKVGDLVRTKMEFEVDKWVQDRVIRVKTLKFSEKTKLIFTDGSYLISSNFHRIWHDNLGDWISVSSFRVGDKASGKEIEEIQKAEYGEVVKITTENHHTYISNGILSHNDKSAPI